MFSNAAVGYTAGNGTNRKIRKTISITVGNKHIKNTIQTLKQ